MTSEQLILEIKKRKYNFIVAIVFLFVASYLFQSKFINQFKSYSNLIVNESDINQLNLPSEQRIESFYTSASIVNRVVLLAYSSEMLDHLIKKFNLYKYYQIDPKEEFAYSKIVEKLSNNIEIKKTDFNMIKLVVSDRDRYEAASIANEMAFKLNEINSNFIKNQVKKKLLIYESVYLGLKNETLSQKDTLIKIIEGMQGIIVTLEKNKIEAEHLKNILTELSGSLKDKNEEMMKMKQFYLFVLNSLNKDNFQTITTVNRALPDYHQDIGFKILYSFLFTLLSTCLLIISLYLLIEHDKHIKLFFS